MPKKDYAAYLLPNPVGKTEGDDLVLATREMLKDPNSRVNSPVGTQSAKIPGYSRDEYSRMEYLDPFGDREELRAQDQTNMEKLGMLFPRVGVKVLSEVSKMPGYLVGLADWASTGFQADEIFRMADNAWINWIEDAEEHINNEYLPVYKRRAVEEGGFWREVISPEFWATDFADGLGFFASMFVPGVAIKSLGLAGKFGRALPSFAKYAKNGELLTQTAVNTVFESAAEAAGTVDALKAYYAPMVASGAMTQQEANQKIGEAGSGVFTTNLAILLGPNFIQNKNILGAFTNKSAAKSVIARAAQETPEIASKNAARKEVAKRVLGSMAAEGFWEEGSQTATENYWSNKAKGLTDKQVVGGILDEYFDMLGTKEGQKSIFLGAVLGSLGGLGGGLRRKMQEEQQVKNLNELLKNDFEGFSAKINDIYKKDKDGNLITKDGVPVKDTKKFLETLTNLAQGEIEAATLERLSEAGNEQAYEEFFNESLTRMAMPYLQHEGGAEVLKSKLSELAESHKETLGALTESKSTDEITAKMAKKVDRLAKRQEHIAHYTNEFYKLKADKGEKSFRDDFVRGLQRTALMTYSRMDHHEGTVERLKKEIVALENEPGSEALVRQKQAELKTAESSLKIAQEEHKKVFSKKEQQVAWGQFKADMAEIEAEINKINQGIEDQENSEVEISEEVSNLSANNVLKETVETPKGKTVVSHKGTIKVSVFENGKLKALNVKKGEEDVEGTEENGAISYWKVEGVDSNGDLRLTSGKQSAKITSTGTFVYGGVHNDYQVAQEETPEQAKTRVGQEAAIKAANRGVQQMDATIKHAKERIKENAKKAEYLMKRISESQDRISKARSEGKLDQLRQGRFSDGLTAPVFHITIEGKKMLVNIAEMEQLIKDLKKQSTMYRKRMKRHKARKVEVLKGIEQVQEKGFDITQYQEEVDRLTEEIEAEQNVLDSTESLLELLERKLAAMKSWIKGLHTQVKNIIVEKYGEKAYNEGIDQDIILKKVEDPDTLEAINRAAEGFEKQDIRGAQVEQVMKNIEEINEKISELKTDVKKHENIMNKYFKEYLKILGHSETQLLAGTVGANNREPHLKAESEIEYFEQKRDAHVEDEDRDHKKSRVPFTGHNSWLRTMGDQAAAIRNDDKDALRWYAFVAKYNFSSKNGTQVLQTITYAQAKELPADSKVRTQIKFYVPSEKKSMTVAEISELEDPAIEEEAGDDIKVFVMTKGTAEHDAEVYEIEKYIVYTSLPLPNNELPSGEPRFGFETLIRNRAAEYARKENAPVDKDMMDRAEATVMADFNASMAEYEKDREKFKKDRTKLKIVGRLPGKKVTVTEPGDVVSSVVINNEDVANEHMMEVYVETSKGTKDAPPTTRIYGQTYRTIPGASYIKNKRTNRLELILQQRLSPEDRTKVVRLIQAAAKAKKGDKIDFVDINNMLKSMLYMYVSAENESNEREGRFQMHMKVDQKDKNKLVSIVFGDIEILAEDIINETEAEYAKFIEFLEHKYHNINNSDFKKESFVEIEVDENGKLSKKVWDKKKGGYTGYLFSRNNRSPKAKVHLNPLAGKSGDAMAKNPQYINSSFSLEIDNTITLKRSKAATSKPAPPVEKKDNKVIGPLGTVEGVWYTMEVGKEDGTRGNADTVIFRYKGGKFEISSESPKANDPKAMQFLNDIAAANLKTKEEFIAFFKGSNINVNYTEHAKNEAETPPPPTDPAPAEYGQAAEEKNTNEMTDEEFEEFMYNTSVDALGDEVEARKFAKKSAASRAKKRDEGSSSGSKPATFSKIEPGTTIEAEAERAWLQKKFPGLPVEIVDRAINGKYGGALLQNLSVVLSRAGNIGTGFHEGWHVYSHSFLSTDGRTALYKDVRKRTGNKELTNEEAEEILAEEFRTYMLGDGTFNFKPKDVRRSAFRKILDGIMDLVRRLTGKEKIDNIEQAFEEVKNGEFVITEETPKPNRDMYRINDKVNETKSQVMLQDLNFRFFNALFGGSTEGIDINSVFSIEDDAAIMKVYDAIKAEYKTSYELGDNLLMTASYIHWNDLVKAHRDFLKQFGVVLSKDIIDEAEENERKDSYSFKASNLTSTKTQLPKPLSMLIAGLPTVRERFDKDMNFLDYEAVVNSHESFEGYSTARYNNTMNVLHTQLAGLASYEDMVAKMRELSSTHPQIGVLLKWLGSWGTIYADSNNPAQVRLQAMFFVQFAKNKNNPLLTYVRESGNINLIDSIADTAKNRILSEWISNAKRSAGREGSFWTKNAAKETVFNKDQTFKAGFMSYQLSTLDLKSLTPSQQIDLLEDMGFTLPETYVDHSGEDVENMLKWIVEKAEDGITIDEFFDKDGAAIRTKIDKVLKSAAIYRADTTELQYINPEGQIEYAITLNSHITNTVTRLNTNRPVPHLENNEFTRNSIWYRRIKAKERLQLVLLRGMSGDQVDGSETSSISHSDYMTMIFNAVLDGYVPFLRSADRKLEYAFKMGNVDNAAGVSKFVATFKGYLQDELTMTLKRRRDGLGEDLKHYQDHAKTLRVFDFIFDEADMERFEALYPKEDTYEAAGRFMEQNMDHIEEQLTNYFQEQTKDTLVAMREAGLVSSLIVDGKRFFTIKGVSNEVIKDVLGATPTITKTGDIVISEERMNNLVDVFTYHYASGMVEQTKLFIGDLANYENAADVFKRTNGATSTRANVMNSDEFNKAQDKLYPKAGGQKYGKTFLKKVLPEHIHSNSSYDELGPLYKKKYNYIKAADAQAKATLDFYRETLLKHAKWEDRHERSYQYEIQSLYLQITNVPEKDRTDAEKAFLESAPNAFLAHTGGKIPSVPMFKAMGKDVGKAIDYMNDALNPFPPLKTQGFGSMENQAEMYAVDFFKHSLAPIIPSFLSRDSMDYQNNLEMMAEGASAYTYPTAQKSVNKPEMEMNFDDFGIQTEVHEEFGGKVVQSTQMRRMEFYDVFGNEEISEEDSAKIRELKQEQIDLTNKYVDMKKNDVLAELGIRKIKGQYILEDSQKGEFKVALKKMFDKRSMPYNMIEGIDVMLDSELMLVDALITKGKIDNVLTASIRSGVIRSQVKGELMIQETAVGYNEDLKFYTNKGKNGHTTLAEVMIPLPQDWVNFVNSNFPGNSFQERLNSFNDLVAAGNYTQIGIPKAMFEFAANRIPTKGPANIEAFKVKKFLPPHAGTRIVVPLEIVTKSGSDFDVDKLTNYFKNYGFDSKGTPTYLDYRRNPESPKAIENRMVEIANEITTHKDNFKALLLPDSADTLKALAEEVRTTETEIGWKDVITFKTVAQKAKAFWAGKSGVAQTAVHNAAHATMQLKNISINEPLFDIYLPEQLNGESNYKLGAIFSRGGQKISEILGEFLTAYVDVAKDPFVFHLNATTENFPIYSLLIRASKGKPSNIETVGKFMTQPIILELTKRMEQNRSIINASNRQSESAIIKQVLYKFGHRGGKASAEGLFGYQLGVAYKEQDPVEHQKYLDVATKLKEKTKYTELTDEQLDSKSDKIQRQVLDNYLMYKAAAGQLNNLQSTTRADSSFPNTIMGIREVEGRFRDTVDLGFFDESDINAYVEETELKVFHDVRSKTPDIFREFYLYKLPGVEARIEVLRQRYAATGMSSDDVTKALEQYERDFITYILHTSPMSNGQTINEWYSELLMEDDHAASVAHLLDKVKKMPEFENNAMLTELHAEFKEYNRHQARKSELNIVKMVTKRLLVEEQNSATVGWKELLESKNPDAKQLGNLLMMVSVMESGMDRSYFSFNDMASNEAYARTISTGYTAEDGTKRLGAIDRFVDKYNGLDEVERGIVLDQVENAFYRNSWANRKVVPRMNKDSVHGKKVHLRKSDRYKGFPYVSVAKAAVSNQEIRELALQGKSIPYRIYLYELTDEVADNKNINIYRQTNKWGDSINFKEMYSDELAESLLESNAELITPEMTPEEEADEAQRLNAESSATIEDDYDEVYQMSAGETKASTELDGMMKNFLNAINVKYQSVKQVFDARGMATDYIAKADMVNRTVQVVEGKADITTLPEEAAHWYVELLGEDHPTYKAMMRDITKFDIYDEVVEEYGEQYKMDTEKLKKEAVGKLIAQNILDIQQKTDRSTAALTARQNQKIRTWWTTIWNNIKKLFSSQDAYAQSAAEIMSNKLDALRAEPVETEMMQRSNRRLDVQDDVAQAAREAKEREAKASEEYIEKAPAEINKVAPEYVETIEDAQSALIRDFEKFFPQYADFNAEERENFVSLMADGHIDIYC